MNQGFPYSDIKTYLDKEQDCAVLSDEFVGDALDVPVINLRNNSAISVPVMPSNLTTGEPIHDGMTHERFQYSHSQLTWYKIPRRISGNRLGLQKRRRFVADLFNETVRKSVRKSQDAFCQVLERYRS